MYISVHKIHKEQKIYERMMLLELDLGINGVNNKTNGIEKFTRDLNNVLQEDKILVYKGYDNRKLLRK